MLIHTELIQKYGYRTESHEVVTEDGYILSLTRILSQNGTKPDTLPLLLVHGLFASSADFVIIGPNNSLAYLLTDRGYDVWLVDLRGNRYSSRHTHLHPDSRAYWNFTWHEMGYYDLPATIDRILEVTGSSQLYYVGYSQGGTAFFVMASARPEYNRKIARMYALSPAVFVQHVRSPIFRFLIANSDTVECILDILGMWKVLPHNAAQYRISRALCPLQDPDTICIRMIGLLVGPNPNGTDTVAQHVITGHNPSGASSKQLVHFVQMHRTGRFQQFDYGRREGGNRAHYGADEPPVYNLTAATAPVAIFYGLNDWMVGPANIARLARTIPNLVMETAVDDQHFNHLDFILSKRVRTLVYEKILNDLNASKATHLGRSTGPPEVGLAPEDGENLL
ncbi:lipase 1-like [Anopheles cruzii]|uniref:lipase 1-like n=1 Tax=Anopheles cruzii TaxID=68878 RepID=UPI0022EC482C|nr:lipase 1-like [Anopheles cruzii]